MKIAYLLNDEILEDKLSTRGEEEGNNKHFYEQPNEFISALQTKDYDYAVLSDRYFDLSTLNMFIETVNENLNNSKTEMIIMLSNRNDPLMNEQMIKFCLSHSLKYIPSGLPVSTVLKMLNEFMCGPASMESADRKRIVLFMGSTPNIGTTLVSFGTALRIARETEHSIGYICLNLKSSKIHRYMGIDDPKTTLDGIRAELKSQSLTMDRFRDCFHKIKDVPNLHILFGNMLREQAEFFTPEDIQYVLKMASECFDFCVVEVSAYWDNAATICGVMCADTKVVVTSKEIGHFQEDIFRWVRSVSPLFQVDSSTFDLFITQQNLVSSEASYSIKDIRKETSMNVIGGMRQHLCVNDYLNRGKIVELLLNHPSVMNDFTGITNTLITLYGLRKGSQQIEKNWYRRLWPGIRTGA